MPTGYTAAIQDGISFNQFVWNCARAFGALVTMRDDPAGAEIPQAFVPSDYHAKELVKEQTALEQLRIMTPQAIEQAAAAAYEAALAEHKQRVGKRANLRMQYDDMLAQATAWEAPAVNVALRDFMIQQIQDSIKFDCSGAYDTLPAAQSGADWLAAERRRIQWGIEYHAKGQRDEISRTAERNKWIAALRASVPMPESQK